MPRHIVSLAGAWVSVGFLDERGQEYAHYDFKELEPDRLFLVSALHRKFAGPSNEVVELTQFAFTAQGVALVERRDMLTDETSERRWHGDVTGNWEQYPRFGDYAALCREERELPCC